MFSLPVLTEHLHRSFRGTADRVHLLDDGLRDHIVVVTPGISILSAGSIGPRRSILPILLEMRLPPLARLVVWVVSRNTWLAVCECLCFPEISIGECRVHAELDGSEGRLGISW